MVIEPRKGGKWRICVDYREMNIEINKYHFSLPFIDQVLDSLEGKQYFSLLDDFNGYNQIYIGLEDHDKTTLTYPWGNYSYFILPFDLCNDPTNF